MDVLEEAGLDLRRFIWVHGLPAEGLRGHTALTNVFPPAMPERGVAEEQMRLITVTNPARAFSF